MDFSYYEKESSETDLGTAVKENDYLYYVLGLVGESGEVAEKFKKIVRDKGGVIGEKEREAIKKELGDVLWYVAAICRKLGIPLEEVAAHNLEKLLDRKRRGKIRGSGDER